MIDCSPWAVRFMMNVSTPAAIPSTTAMTTSAASLDRNSRRTAFMPRDTFTVCCTRERLPPITSLHRHALGQVARLVDVGAFQNRHMISEQLHRHGIDQGRYQRVDLGHFDRRDTALTRCGNSRGIADQDDAPAAGPDLLHVADR